MAAYFDTNVIRYLRTGLTGELPLALQRKIVLSPVSAIEVLTQLAGPTPDDALNSLHRLRDWIPEQAPVLDWLEPFISWSVFGHESEDPVFPLVTRMVDTVLHIRFVTPDLIRDAQALRDFNENAKRTKATLFRDCVLTVRGDPRPLADLEAEMLQHAATSVALRVGQGVNEANRQLVLERLSAYCAYHIRLIVSAAANPRYNFFSRAHLNDQFDAEQLIYLARPDLHFITTDTGYRSIINDPQSPQVHLTEARAMQDSTQAGRILEVILENILEAPPVVGPA